MLKVVVDTSVFLAGILSKNPMSYPSQLISMWRNGDFMLVMSPQMLRELVAKLVEKDIDEEIIVDFVKVIAQIAINIPGACETSKLNDIDPDDNMFLAAAYEFGADYIVSYDAKSMLPLKHWHGTQIRTPELFMRVLMLPPEEIEDERIRQDFEGEYKMLT